MVFTKNALLFLSWALTHHSFTFNFKFLHELKHKVHLSKTLCVGFSIFGCLVLLMFIVLKHRLFDFKIS